ncbi:MAG: Fe-S cluster assembly protein SufD [Bacteroidia bacterium]|nr:Fe-S cluster assembly protein SufD [Bacteroidia bacterium]
MDTPVLTQDTALQTWTDRFRQEAPATPAREAARQALETLAFPTRKWEAWKYTDIRHLLKQDFRQQPAQGMDPVPGHIPGLEADRLVFINGVFSPSDSDLSRNAGLATICPLAAAPAACLAQMGDLVGHQDIFAALNTAWAQAGVCVYVPDNQALAAPIHILHLSQPGETPLLSQHRNLLIIGAGARVTLLDAAHSTNSHPSFANHVTELWIGEGAEVDLIKLQDESAQATRIDTTVVSLAGKSRCSVFTFTLGGQLVRNNLSFLLTAPQAEGNLYGGYLLRNTQMVDNYTQVQHIAPHCLSNELYKGIIADQATSVFTGRIHVHKDAQKTNAYQSNRNILLSETGTVNTRPQLEIYADDVKCSHGAATGRLDENALYYLRARGIPERQARMMLIHAFAMEVASTLTLDPLVAYIEQRIHDAFS